MGSNPETETILKRHIAIAKNESPEKNKARAKPVPKDRVIFGFMR